MGWSKYFIHVPYSPISIQALLCFLFNVHTPMITSERNLKFSMLPKDTFVCSSEQLLTTSLSIGILPAWPPELQPLQQKVRQPNHFVCSVHLMDAFR